MDTTTIIAWLSQNWELVAIGVLLLDKLVALSPTKADDLLWTGLKKILFTAVGKKTAAIVLPVLLTLPLMGCGTKNLSPQESFVKTSQQTLAVAGNTYDSAMKAAGDYYHKGRISEAQKKKILEYGDIFYGVYHLARESLSTYTKTLRSSGDDPKLYRVAVEALSDIWPKLDDVLEYARRVGVKIPEEM